MNIQKYKQTDCHLVLLETDPQDNFRKYLSENEPKKNIDLTKINLDYSLTNFDTKKAEEKIKKAIAEHDEKKIEMVIKGKRKLVEKKLRSDAVVMGGVCITLPQSLNGKITSEQEREFFKTSKEFFLKHFNINADDVLIDTIHKDETTPHLHLYFMPRENNRFNAKKILSKDKFETLHDYIDTELKRTLDFYDGGILLDDTQKLIKATSGLHQEEMVTLNKIARENVILKAQTQAIETLCTPRQKTAIKEETLKNIERTTSPKQFNFFKEVFLKLLEMVKPKKKKQTPPKGDDIDPISLNELVSPKEIYNEKERAREKEVDPYEYI